MPYRPPENRIVEVVELAPGDTAPAGSTWVRVNPYRDRSCDLTGNLEVPGAIVFGYGFHSHISEALERSLTLAMEQDVGVLYIETRGS